MLLKFLLVFSLALASHQSLAAPEADLITSLPGLSYEPGFKQYSGYLSPDETKRLHYWFVESSGNPSTDPLVLWLDGGPGCSSVFALLAKHGPFRVTPDGQTLVKNPFAWNQVANIIYLESPAGVGFSYATDKNYATGDDETAKNNYNAVNDFMSKFPEYASRDFYIAGASYSGIYVPLLAQLVMQDSAINLKGFSVGNGLHDYPMNENSQIYYLYYHGMFGAIEWQGLLKACCPGVDSSACDFASSTNPSCQERVNKVTNVAWNSGLDPYNLYKLCYNGAEGDSTLYWKNKLSRDLGRPFWFNKSSSAAKQKSAFHPGANSFLPCRNDRQLLKYLSRSEVRQALHIPDEALQWDLCSDLISSTYRQEYNTMKPQYQAAMAKKLRMIVYNGDFDMACNSLGGEWFVDSLNASNPQGRRFWYYTAEDGTRQVSGFVKAFDNITFATILGAGHMVPEDKPRPAFDLFSKFLQNKPL